MPALPRNYECLQSSYRISESRHGEHSYNSLSVYEMQKCCGDVLLAFIIKDCKSPNGGYNIFL